MTIENETGFQGKHAERSFPIRTHATFTHVPHHSSRIS